MHELPVTESILQIALDHAQKANATRITNLYLVIGQLASIVDDSVQFYWDIIAKDSIAEGAQLHFTRIPAEMHCHDCQTRYKMNGESFACPTCGGINLEIVAGKEFYVEAIDVETADDPA